jgi:hypothetical protein
VDESFDAGGSRCVERVAHHDGVPVKLGIRRSREIKDRIDALRGGSYAFARKEIGGNRLRSRKIARKACSVAAYGPVSDSALLEHRRHRTPDCPRRAEERDES